MSRQKKHKHVEVEESEATEQETIEEVAARIEAEVAVPVPPTERTCGCTHTDVANGFCTHGG